MKKLRMKRLVKIVLVIGIIIMLLSLLAKLNNDFMNDCIKAGYSKEYCEMGK